MHGGRQIFLRKARKFLRRPNSEEENHPEVGKRRSNAYGNRPGFLKEGQIPPPTQKKGHKKINNLK